jgi:hypothetical protein
MAKREDFFECILSSDNNEYRFHFRAWNAEDAETHFRAALLADGVTVPGTLLIRSPRGEILKRAPFGPSTPGGGARPGPSPR